MKEDERVDAPGERREQAAAPPRPAIEESASDESLSADAKQQVLDDLEEADFYMQQGLHDEASAIYQRVLAVAPNHPRAMLRLGEIAAAGGAPPLVATSDSDETPVPDLSLDDEDSFSVAAEAEASDPTPPAATADESDDGDELFSIDAPDEVLPSASDESLADLDLGDSGAGIAAASAGESPIAEGEPSEAEDETEAGSGDGSTQELRPQADGSPASEPRPAPGIDVSPPILGAEGDFDLAAALSDAFDDDPGSSQTGIATGANDDGFAAVFDAFKKGVSETLTEGDHQAHYDLAIAYKEMGLLDDAINELRTAMADPGRTAECLHLIGLCAIDADQAPLAIEHLEQLLMLPDLDPKAAMAGRFDLGRAFESVSDFEGARREWESVVAIDPDFQNVSARLASLGAPKPDAADDGGFESFDGFMDGIDDSDDEDDDDVMAAEEIAEPEFADAEEIAAPEFAESEAIIELDEPADEVDAPPSARPKPAPKPAARRKKKKISFL